MAEYDLTPLYVDDDIQGTYDLLKRYFLRENNPFNIITDFCSEDGFTIDFMRSYSFIATEHRATVHLSGIPQEDGTTKVTMHAKSVENVENLNKEIRDRIDDAMKHMVAQKKEIPYDDAGSGSESGEKTKKSNKVELIVVLVVAALIILGTFPISCSEEFSRFWIF